MALKNKDGHWIDPQGNPVPAKYVDKVDKLRDRLVGKLTRRAGQISETLGKFRADAFADVEKYLSAVEEIYGVSARNPGGNKILADFSQTAKVEIKVNNVVGFDDRIVLAKGIIDECTKRWSVGGDDRVKLLVDYAFKVDKQGNLDRDLILGLRKLDIKDKNWRKAMEILSDSLRIVGTRAYIRFWKKNEAGAWETLPLDIAQF